MSEVSDLDAFLEEAGEDVILRRRVGSIDVDVTIRATVRLANKPNVLVSGTIQDDLKVVTSMTKILAANWPLQNDAGTPPFLVEANLPRRGDTLIINGMRYRVESSNPIRVKNVVVRVVLLIKGGASGA